MPTHQSRTATETAVGALSNLGLTSYEAKCYVALLRLGRGTAREVADVSTVPRSRVYDATGSLHDRGFVDIEHANPRTYRPAPLDRALELLSARREAHETALREAAANLPATEAGDDTDDGVWTVSNPDHVCDRETRLLEGADEWINAYANGEDLTQSFLSDLRSADERGVEVALAVDGERASERAAAELGAGAEVVVTEAVIRQLEPDFADDASRVARAFCADGEAALVVSALANERTGARRESAVWSRRNGPGVGFVHLVAGALDGVRT